jgi:hypothetical protein
MPRFQVFSGTVNVTILAEDPHSAAVELLQSRRVENRRWDDASNDRGVGEQIIVVPRGERRPPERFITLHLLAHLNRQTPASARRRKLASFDPNNN